MNEHIESLFQLTRSRITTQHIIDYTPYDPGYDSYVELWTHILVSGEIPKTSDFCLSEVIGLTGWSDPKGYKHPERFRAYRRFTSTVAAALIELGNDTERVRIGNYMARDLIIDADVKDQKHFNLLRKAFPAIRSALIKLNHADYYMNDENEYPYFTCGSLILAQMAGDYDSSLLLASQLIDDDADVRNDESLNYAVVNSNFLFGLTGYHQLNSDWLHFISKLTNPSNDETLQLVIESLLESFKH